MNKRMAEKIARYHARNPGCSPYKRGKFEDQVWRDHFRGDARQMMVNGGREPKEGEIGRIVAFLVSDD